MIQEDIIGKYKGYILFKNPTIKLNISPFFSKEYEMAIFRDANDKLCINSNIYRPGSIENTYSSSIGKVIVKYNEDNVHILFTYLNGGDKKLGFAPHNGNCELIIKKLIKYKGHANVPETLLEGSYVTNRNPRTTGFYVLWKEQFITAKTVV